MFKVSVWDSRKVLFTKQMQFFYTKQMNIFYCLWRCCIWKILDDKTRCFYTLSYVNFVMYQLFTIKRTEINLNVILF